MSRATESIGPRVIGSHHSRKNTRTIALGQTEGRAMTFPARG
jgi:hypothetical protein